MDLEIIEPNKAPIEIFTQIPDEMQKHVISSAIPLFAKGERFIIMMQQFHSEGFTAWYSRYWMKNKTFLNAKSNLSALELRISLRNCILGKWDKVANAELPAYSFQMNYVPYIVTNAIFESAGEYETFDIHFDFNFLQSIGLDYKTLDTFLNAVSKNNPAELSKRHCACTPFMMDAIDNILHNSYSLKAKEQILANNIFNILIAALETVGKDEIGKIKLSEHDIDAMYNIRAMIDEEFPIYPSNKTMVTKAATNLFKLHHGFKHLFGMNPYDYYREKRFMVAKQLLRKGLTVDTVRKELNYGSSAAFVREFKRRFDYTPGEFRNHK